MSKKCHEGQPFEFKAKYEGVVIKAPTGPDTGVVYGLKMQNFSWLAPSQVQIGKGFSVKPDLPHGIVPPYGPTASYDLELIVTGPGLPQAGIRVKPKWALSSCLSAAANVICKQFMQLETVKSKSGASEFTVVFVRGYTEQEFKTGWNTAWWRICYDGPFEMIKAAPLPNPWEIRWIIEWIGEPITELKELGSAPGAELPVEPGTVTIETMLGRVSKASVPDDQEDQRRGLLEALERMVPLLHEAESLVRHANETASEGERLDLRAAAIDHLQRAHELSREAVELLSRLEEEVEGRV
jgi:hypothetical protein